MRRLLSEKPHDMTIGSRFFYRTLLPCLLVLGVAGAIATGCSEKAPTAPTPPPVAATVTSVSVTGPGSAQTGQTAAMVATASMSDGTTQNVTTTAAWQSSNPAAAPVSATGVVSFQAVGESDIRATFSGQTGTLHVTVTARPPSSFTLFGIVTQQNSNDRPVLGVPVEAITGPNTGRNTTTDGNGYYSVPMLEGTFTVRFSRNDYETRDVTGTLSADTRLDVPMKSTLPPPPDVSRFFGTYRVNLSVSAQSCSEPVSPGSTGTVELGGRDDGSRVTASMTERGQTRSYNGSMAENGGFGGTGSGLINLRGFQTHDWTGSLGATVSGNSISGTETIRYGLPCPGGVLTIRFSGSR